LLKEPIATKPSEAALHKPFETYDLERTLPALTIAVPAVLAQQMVRGDLATFVTEHQLLTVRMLPTPNGLS
jgi:hypothetical protein